MILTFKYRIKDATTGKYLNEYAIVCNQVWNYCCEVQRKAESNWKSGQCRYWPSAFDLIKLCTGSSKLLGLHSDTIQAICRQFAVSRDAKRKCPRFRASFGSKRSLGWIPFIQRAVKIDGDATIYMKRRFRFWKSRNIEGKFKAGSFVQDARGRWYVIFQCEVEDDKPKSNGSIGIDLGLKALATTSKGEKIPNLKYYRKYEQQLGVAQRANNKKRVKAIHAKIANSRRHHLHEQSTKIVRENSLIVVGNVSASKLAKTRMGKSVLDAGWSSFRHMLAYKARRHQAAFIEVDERYSSRRCSRCGVIPDSSPKGIGALGIRQWKCSSCGCDHDRDVNAARNILIAGAERRPPVVEIPALKGGDDVKRQIS